MGLIESDSRMGELACNCNGILVGLMIGLEAGSGTRFREIIERGFGDLWMGLSSFTRSCSTLLD